MEHSRRVTGGRTLRMFARRSGDMLRTKSIFFSWLRAGTGRGSAGDADGAGDACVPLVAAAASWGGGAATAGDASGAAGAKLADMGSAMVVQRGD